MSGWDSDTFEPSRFEEVLVCIPFDRYRNPSLETGNKVVMPPSSLARLAHLRIDFPWFFKMESFGSDKVSHCGVLEFGAEEGVVYVPRWMMANLGVGDGEEVVLREARPPRGTWMKLQPHETAFVEVSNVRAVMETGLRGFSCLSKGDTIVVRYNGRDFYIDVLDVGPGGGVVSLVDTDCVVEFAPPLDYVEPPPVEEGGGAEEEEEKGFRPFTGRAARLDGEAVGRRLHGEAAAEKKKREKGEEREIKFKAFAGRGRLLGGPNFFHN